MKDRVRTLGGVAFSRLVLMTAFALLPASAGEVRVWRGGYPPPPKPIATDVTLGAYIFPGWYRDKGRGDYPYPTHDEESEWRLIARRPQPRPLLGFYDDSLPEVNDWHIKWALEHGVSFFAFDWYWNAGEHRLLRTLERGFLKARYASQMKFCIHWCNHGLDWKTRRWYPMMGLAATAVKDGALEARVTSNDPAFACVVRMDAARIAKAVIRMKVDRGEHAQLFWSNDKGRTSERNSIPFKIIPDNTFHEYILDLAAVDSWTGRINSLRLDPTAGPPGARVEVDFIRFLDAEGRVDERVRWEFNDARTFNGLTAAGLDFRPTVLVEMVEYMAERYFKLPNYLTVDGRPVLMIWDPRALARANGGPEGFRKVLQQMNAALEKRGVPPLYLVSVRSGRDIAAMGFDAVSGYGYYGADFDAPYEWHAGSSLPYEIMVRHYETMWESISRSLKLPYLLPIGTNWDSRPRHGSRAAVITGKTPEKFRVMCENSRKYLDKRLNMAIIEAWNEWGEGSFLEPDREWRFDFLDTVREVFSKAPRKHVDYVPPPEKIAAFSVLTPAERKAAAETAKKPDVPPPLYPRSTWWKTDQPLPAASVLKRWEFDTDTTQGWTSGGVREFGVRDGLLRAEVVTEDPQFLVGDVDVAVEDLRCLAVRLRVTGAESDRATSCEVFWSTKKEPALSADKAFRFKLLNDGQWHTYQVSRKPRGKWSGRLGLLRLDVGRPGDTVEIDWVRLYGR
ncbi:MAG: hypothetical protein GXP31_15595 [Kiritimatiellaeota bacterium]|nr:hypothetical protein [Kiritimatiellota bacterium]